ncbi:MAG: alpha-rhamnosidase [Bacteroidales bacterium]|nr:alpha-rhamnosidase [Bacteroidales bacterium]
MRRLIYILVALIAVACSKPRNEKVVVCDLRTEHLQNPTEIASTAPRLGWRLESSANDVRQLSYHIIVSSTRENAENLVGDLWDSAVDSPESQWITYAGAQLKSDTRCFWRVNVTTNCGETGWSDVATWNVGLLNESDWSGQWIGLDKANSWDVEEEHSQLSARYIRSEFNADDSISSATLYICGLGLYEAFINGQRVGSQELAPAPTDYRRTALYNAYDVTEMLKSGERNAIGVTLSNGRFYTMQQHKKPYKITNFGYPRLRANIVVRYANGKRQVISTNNKWKLTADGPVRSANEYDGEIYDARKELGAWTIVGFDDSKWQNAERVASPYGTLRPQEMPGMAVVDSVAPINITRRGNSYIVDFGENMAGRVRIATKNGKAGESLVIRYAEKLTDEGELYTENLRHAYSVDKYIYSGREKRGDTWNAHFVYHGFRYVEVSGVSELTSDDIQAQKISDLMERTGYFHSNDSTLNKVFSNVVRGIQANYKGMPVDCPQRDERQPWLGDRTMGTFGESYIFDNHALYTKWMRDISEAQREDGCIPDVAPAFWNYYSDIVTWPAAFPFTLQMLSERFKDNRPMQHYFPDLMRWVKHMRDCYLVDGILTKDKYGDWCVPPEDIKMIHSQDPARVTEGALISTAYYSIICSQMSHAAKAHNLGTAEEIELLDDIAYITKKAFLDKYLTVKRGTAAVPGHVLYPDSTYFGNNTVTANLLGLQLSTDEYVRNEAVKNIVRNIVTLNSDHISCGVIGVQWLMRTLSAMGYNDVAWRLATQNTYPSWGYMAAQGATTIWELWNGDTASPKMNSGNHVMLLGDLVPWIFEDIVGVRNIENRHITLQPEFNVDEIYDIEGSYKSIYGNIVSRWQKSCGKLAWHIEIPANTTATAVLPDGSSRELVSGVHNIEVNMPQIHKSVVCNEFLYKETSFPQCHSATIAELPDGTLACTYFGGTRERNPDVCIWVSLKHPGDSVWSEPILAADGVFMLGTADAALAGVNDSTTEATKGLIKPRLADDNFATDVTKLRRKACWNPVIYQEPNGDLLIYFKIGLKVADWSGWVVRSKDGGKTWQDRQPLQKEFLGPIKNKIVESQGRLIAPSSVETNGWRCYFELSDDGGSTWRKTDYVQQPDSFKTIQPSVITLNNGRLAALCRTRNRQIAITYSEDNGETWSEMKLIDTPNNNSGLDAAVLPDGSFVMACNEQMVEPGKTKGARTPLSLLRSSDGENWTHWVTLEKSPIGQYSYPSVFVSSDGHVHAVYTWRRLRVKHVELIP